MVAAGTDADASGAHRQNPGGRRGTGSSGVPRRPLWTGPTQVTWADVEPGNSPTRRGKGCALDRRRAGPTDPTAGDPAGDVQPAARTSPSGPTARPRSTGTACPTPCAPGWPRSRPPRSAACRPRRARCRCAGSPGSPRRSGPSSGAPPLLAELACVRGRSARAVVAWWDEHRPASSPALDADDPLTAAAAAVLVGDPAAADAWPPRPAAARSASCAPSCDAALSRVDKLTVELERLRGELAESRGPRSARPAPSATPSTSSCAGGSPSRAPGCGPRSTRAAAAEQAVEDCAERAPARARRASGPSVDRERARAEAERRRADRAAAEVAAARQAAREARQADEVRLALLLDTLGGAVAGLRRELALGGGGPRPGRPGGRGAGRPGRRRGRHPGRARRAARGAVGAPDRRRLQRQQDRLPRAPAGRPAHPAGRPAGGAGRAHRGGDHASSSTGRAWSTAPTRGGARACGCCSATPACSPTT